MKFSFLLFESGLPSPTIIRSVIKQIVTGFQDTVQVELVKTRWEEIKNLKAEENLALA
jgi:hypothetical protein